VNIDTGVAVNGSSPYFISLALVFNGTQGRFFVDGSLNKEIPVTYIPSNSVLTVGGDPQGIANNSGVEGLQFHGYIDSLRIFVSCSL
jgi:hypothetical protein